MIVQCPECASRYRVNDANIPSSGGKITCPKCSNKFIVYPERQAEQARQPVNEDATSVAYRPDMQELVRKMREQSGQAGGDAAATEVMSGDNLPAFMGGGGDESTREMRNPFGDDPAAPTEVVSGDSINQMFGGGPAINNDATQEVQMPGRGQPSGATPSRPQPPQQPQAQPPQQPQAPPTPPPEPEPAAGPNADHDGPWKLRTNFGLTYEFPDTKGLKNWMSSREDLDGYALSGDGGDNFYPLDEWPQVAGSQDRVSQQLPSFDRQTGRPAGATNAPGPASQPPSPQAGARGGAVGSGGGMPDRANPPSTPGPRIESTSYRPPSEEAKWNKVLWLVFAVLLVVAAAIALQTFGIYDVKGAILGTPSQPAVQPNPAVPAPQAGQDAPAADEAGAAAAEDKPAADPQAAENEMAQQVDDLILEARRAIKDNRLQSAVEKLERAKIIAPERARIYELLAQVHGDMGQTEQADEAAAKAEELKAAAAPAEEGDEAADSP